MCDQSDLLAEIHRKSAEKLICLLILFEDLSVFEMSLDLVEKSIWYFLCLLKFDQCIQLFLKLLVVIVKTLEHLGHVTDSIGVKSYSNNDAAYCNNPFNTVVSRNISEADSCESLKAPIERNEIVKPN